VLRRIDRRKMCRTGNSNCRAVIVVRKKWLSRQLKAEKISVTYSGEATGAARIVA